jgi:hypothetical protein
MTQYLTPDQIARLAAVCDSYSSDAKNTPLERVWLKPWHGHDAIAYQLHHIGGTFGSWVALDAAGRHEWQPGFDSAPITPGAFVDGLIAGGTTNIDPSR